MWWLVGIIVFLIAVFVVYMLHSGLSEADKLIAAQVTALTYEIIASTTKVKNQSMFAVDNADAATKNLAAAEFDMAVANANAASTASSNATAAVVDLQDFMSQYQILAIQMTDLITKDAYNIDIAAKNKLVTQAETEAQAAANAAADAQKVKTAVDNIIKNASKPSATNGSLPSSDIMYGIDMGIDMGTNFDFVVTTDYGSTGNGAVAAVAGSTGSNDGGLAVAGSIGSIGSTGSSNIVTSNIVTSDIASSNIVTSNIVTSNIASSGDSTNIVVSGGGSVNVTVVAQPQLTADEIAFLSKLTAKEQLVASTLPISDQKIMVQIIKTYDPIKLLIDKLEQQGSDITAAYNLAIADVKNYVFTNLVNYSNVVNTTSSSIEANITNLKSQVPGYISIVKSLSSTAATSLSANNLINDITNYILDTSTVKGSASSILTNAQMAKTQIADLIARSAIVNKFQKKYIKGGTKDKTFTLGVQKDELACQQALLDKYPMPANGIPNMTNFGFGYTYVAGTGDCNAIVGTPFVNRDDYDRYTDTKYRADPTDLTSLLYGADNYDIVGYDKQEYRERYSDCRPNCTTPDCAWMNGSLGRNYYSASFQVIGGYKIIPIPKNERNYHDSKWCYTKTLEAKDSSDALRYMPDQAISRMRIDTKTF